MPHNENYLHNILWQRLQDYHPAGEGSGEGACPSPEKITRYKSNYLHHVRIQCTIWSIFPQQGKPHVKEYRPVNVSWVQFITIGGYTVIMYFTGRNWFLLAPSKLVVPKQPYMEETRRILTITLTLTLTLTSPTQHFTNVSHSFCN